MSSVAMTVSWVEVRDAALGATRWGWPVVAGTFLGPDRHWHGREWARGLGPISPRAPAD